MLSLLLIGVGILGIIISLVILRSKLIDKKIRKVTCILPFGTFILLIVIGVLVSMHQHRLETYRIGMSAYENKDFERAIFYLLKVKSYYPKAESIIRKIPTEAFEYFYSKGKIALEKNEFDKAINNFEVAKGWAQNDTNAISKATMALKRAKRLKGKKLYEEGVKEYKGGNYEIARTYFIRAESCGYKVDKDWFERINSQLAWKHYKLGRHHYRNEEYDKAVLEFQKALNLNPNLSVAKKWLKRAQYWANMTPRERMFEKAIREGKIMLGMTKEQVIRAWGKPNDINKMVFTDLYGVEHVHEQWRYGSIYGGYFLYFEDGILTSWQEY